MSNPSWGHDYSVIDKLFEPFKEKLGHYCYDNFYPFKSKSGKWYAFHNDQYSDIKIVEIETGKTVVKHFYSNKGVYLSHTNASTYVPAFVRGVYESPHTGRTIKTITNDHDFEDSENITLDMIESVPIAINSWTIWAADYEFYVDAIDLRRIDEGIVRKLKFPQKVISRDCLQVRNVVECQTDYWYCIKKEGETDEELKARQDAVQPTSDFKFLVENHDLRFSPKEPDHEEDIYDPNGVAGKYEVDEELPWQESKRWLDERKKSDVQD